MLRGVEWYVMGKLLENLERSSRRTTEHVQVRGCEFNLDVDSDDDVAAVEEEHRRFVQRGESGGCYSVIQDSTSFQR